MGELLACRKLSEIVDGLTRLLNDSLRQSEEDYRSLKLGDAEIDHIFRLADALWLHGGDPRKPHALLTSGKHSDGFVDVLRALKYTPICDLMGALLMQKVTEHHHKINWVVGSDHAGAVLSYSVALHLAAKHDFTEKGPDKAQVWKRFSILPDESVLQVEELITTTGTLQAVREGIRQAHPYPINFAPVVATLIHRSDQYEFQGSPIIYLRHLDIKTWEADKCPLCAQGSVAIRPKENWALLTD